MSFPQDKIKNILIIRPDAIGDLVLITPALHALRKNFPKARISILVQKYTSDLVNVHPDIDEVIIDDIREKKVNNLKDYFNYVRKIKEKRFDLGIDFYSFDYRYPLLMLLAGIPYRVGDRSRVMLSFFYNWGTILKYKDYTKHMVELHLELLKKLGIEEKNPQLNVYIPEEIILKFKVRLSELGILDSDFLIGIHPGCGASRPWDSNGYAELCDALQQKFGAKVVITGGPREREKAAEIISLCKSKPINLVEKTSLAELSALIKRFNLYIGVDTGPIHLAAALGTPLVLLLLAKNVKPVRWGPWKTRHFILYPHPASGCPLYCDPGKCRESYCSDKLTVSNILDAAERLKKNDPGNSLEDWRKMSFNILLISEKSELADKVVSQVKSQGFNISLLPPEQIGGVKKLLKIIETKNILILHQLGNKARVTTWFANLLSGIYTTNATVLVRGYHESENIFDQYYKAFNNSLL